MKIAAVACFSNELAIASAFRDQLETFFDKSYLISHNSYDKTEEIFLNLERFSVTKVRDKVFRQAELVRDGMVKAFSEGADWVVFLDFDEFLPFDNRILFEKFLIGHSTKDVIFWNWVNIFPEKLGSTDLFAQPFVTLNNAQTLTKIIVAKSAYQKDPNLLLTHGSHSLISNQKIEEYREKNFKLIHIPIHGLEHFKQKVMQREVTEGDSAFFREFMETYIAKGSFNLDLLREVALNYCGDRNFRSKQIIFDFNFPYVKSKYLAEKESAIDSLFAIIYNMLSTHGDTHTNRIEREVYLEELSAKEIIESRSWKITRPLRAANSALKKFKSLKI